MGRITEEDYGLIKGLRQGKQWGAKRLKSEFPNKGWSTASLSRLIRKIDCNGSTKRKFGSGRRRSVRTETNIAQVKELICSPAGRPHFHKSPREIERETGISRSSVRRIAKHDLTLNTYRRISGQKLNNTIKEKRVERCRMLLLRFPNERSIRNIWFTDEKIFTVSAPVNSQNDRFYSEASRKKESNVANLIRQREHFSRSIMVSVGVSRMGKTRVVFVDPGAKIDSQYYCRNVLGNGLLPDIENKCGTYRWTLQQDGAPSHTAKNTLHYLRQRNVTFIEPGMWPPNSPDLNPVDYAVWGALQQLVYRRKDFATVDELKKAIIEAWQHLSQAFIDKCINQWRSRLEYVVQQNGGHIEQNF